MSVRSRLLVLTPGILMLAQTANAQAASVQGAAPAQLTGHVTDANGAPIAGARVVLVESRRFAHTGPDGVYLIRALPAGRHAIQAVRVGYAPSTIDTVELNETSISHNFQLQAAALPLSQMIVTPGSYGLLDQRAGSQQVITREELLARPQLAEDLFRSLNRLPGFSGSDFSAQVRIRNSAADEVLVTLDGLELVEPFHMKDFEGALTILDQDAVGRAQVNTGGFGAAFGNRAAGLILLSSTVPEENRTRTAFGLSLSNLRARTQGRFSNGRGTWLLSARRGYLDVVFDLLKMDDVPDPTYYDAFGKVQYQAGSRHLLALHSLVARDRMRLNLDEGTTIGSSSYANGYHWMRVESQWSDRLRSTSLASIGALSWNRDGRDAEFFGRVPFPHATFRDRRALNTWSVKQDWTADTDHNVSVLWGAEARREAAEYDYSRARYNRVRINGQIVLIDSVTTFIRKTVAGTRLSGYTSVRARPIPRFTIEGGLRADHHQWIGQTVVAPRFNVTVDITGRTVMRGAWGVYAQAQSLHELPVIDGDSTFARAERSEQRVLSAEQRIGTYWSFRVEAFSRHMRHARPRYLSTDGEFDNFPEGQPDRVLLRADSSRVLGIESLLTYDAGRRLRVTAWYARTDSRAYVGPLKTARPFGERHSGAFDATFRLGKGWTSSLAGTAHSGWPSIPGSFAIDTIAAGQYDIRRNPSQPVFSEHLSAYRRLDARLARRWSGERHSVNMYIEMFNLFGRRNQRGWTYDARAGNGQLTVSREPLHFIGRLPSVGINWEF